MYMDNLDMIKVWENWVKSTWCRTGHLIENLPPEKGVFNPNIYLDVIDSKFIGPLKFGRMLHQS